MSRQTRSQSSKLGLKVWFGLSANTVKQDALKDIIEASALQFDKRQETFLEDVWLNNTLEIDRRAHGYKSMYIIFRAIAIIGSLALPILILTPNPLVSIIISLIVAVSAGWEAFFRYGEKWQLFRRMSVEMENTGVLFLQKLVLTEDHYEIFVKKIMATIKKKVEGYNDIVEQSLTDYSQIQDDIKAAVEANLQTRLGKKPVGE